MHLLTAAISYSSSFPDIRNSTTLKRLREYQQITRKQSINHESVSASRMPLSNKHSMVT